MTHRRRPDRIHSRRCERARHIGARGAMNRDHGCNPRAESHHRSAPSVSRIMASGRYRPYAKLCGELRKLIGPRLRDRRLRGSPHFLMRSRPIGGCALGWFRYPEFWGSYSRNLARLTIFQPRWRGAGRSLRKSAESPFFLKIRVGKWGAPSQIHFFTRNAALARFDFTQKTPKSTFFYDPLNRLRSNFHRINHGSESS